MNLKCKNALQMSKALRYSEICAKHLKLLTNPKALKYALYNIRCVAIEP